MHMDNGLHRVMAQASQFVHGPLKVCSELTCEEGYEFEVGIRV